ncbi:MAG: lytic polysaccharide monooxygenase [Candidatus Dadabacteria bacterium]|nr:lytic polysaccharide monooxygenase [Candidatus Dadabacteria bacterium]
MKTKRFLLYSSIFIYVLSFMIVGQEAFGHGSMETPISRIYNCFLENPENPKSDACKAAVEQGGTQALYDWNGVNQGNANDMHREIIPDGKLCSAGKELFKGMDLARNDWHTTMIAPNGIGNFEFVFIATAPHSTKYYRFYVTEDGYNPLNPLKWTDLEESPFCTITDVTLENGRYKMSCPFPQGKSGKHIIYSIWQRDDSPEAFYTCMDVEFTGGAPVVWRSLGQVRAQQDLAVGDSVTFRLFDAQLSDAETHKIELQEGEAGSNQWPFYLAQQVNSNSSLVKIGVLDSSGNINPVKSSQNNNVYVSSEQEFSFQVDIEMVDNGGGGKDCDCCDSCTNPGPDPDPTGGVDFIYPHGIGSYVGGTVVQGTDGKRYECKPFPFSGWCNQSELYYAPGSGLAWTDAWIGLD